MLLLKGVFLLLNAAFAMAIQHFHFTFTSCVIYQATQIVDICRILHLCVINNLLSLVAVDSHSPSFFHSQTASARM